jgi:predicted ATPase/DNA-binding winged helix-turn-helix (wHTH) protein
MSTTYQIGPFHLDPALGALTRDGVAQALGARGVAVLAVLVEHPNEFVPKATIIDAAWPGLVVGDSNLAVQVSAIRRALAQVPGGERWIETLSRRAYRFVGPIVVNDLPSQLDPGSARCNIPEPPTSFIGRERELVQIKRLLAKTRLLTLVGAGGIGKTRLALQAAAEIRDAYRDGVWLVELASITDPSLVASSVAQVLGVREKTGAAMAASIAAHLVRRELLLLVDNCEHVRESCARLIDAVLRETTGTTVVATSREPLKLAGEQIYELPALSLPDRDADAQAAIASEAVQLFVERAQRQQPEFTLTGARARAVAQLCIELDGIPLALELAAARIRSLSVEQMNDRLHDRFRLLTGGIATAMPRQQTLRATFDWSYDLLTNAERAALRRLAVFPASFTLEAAAAVLDETGVDESGVVDLVAQLVARSIVLADTSQGRTRYRLLQTTRAYALEKLSGTGEADPLRHRHARHYRDVLAHARHLASRQRRAILFPELDNVRAALDWSLGDNGEHATGVALAASSSPLWHSLSLLHEGRRRLEAAAAALDAKTPLADHARLWHSLGSLRGTADPAGALAALDNALRLCRRLGDARMTGDTLVETARMQIYMGRFAEASVALEEARPLVEKESSPPALAFYLENAGFLRMLTGDFPAARTLFEQALALYRVLEFDDSILAMLLNLADMKWALGDLDAALVGFREAAARMRETPQFAKKDMLGVCLTNLAGVLTERGDLAEALAVAREGLPLRRELNARAAWDHLALRAGLAGQLPDAARVAGYVDRLYVASQSRRQPNEARARARLTEVLGAKLSPEEVARLLREGASMSEDEALKLALGERLELD